MLEIGLRLRKNAIKKTKYKRFHNYSWRLWFLVCVAITTSCDWQLPRKTVTYESAKCVPCNTRKCTHNGFVSDLLK